MSNFPCQTKYFTKVNKKTQKLGLTNRQRWILDDLWAATLWLTNFSIFGPKKWKRLAFLKLLICDSQRGHPQSDSQRGTFFGSAYRRQIRRTFKFQSDSPNIGHCLQNLGFWVRRKVKWVAKFVSRFDEWPQSEPPIICHSVAGKWLANSFRRRGRGKEGEFWRWGKKENIFIYK